MQPLALNAFNPALELNDEDSELVVQVNQQKGTSDTDGIVNVHFPVKIFTIIFIINLKSNFL